MAYDKLALYNEALSILGERKLADLAEEVEPRRQLDLAYDNNAPGYCASIIKPTFLSKVKKLTVFAASVEYGYANTFDLPADYLSMVQPYSNAGLDEKIERYIIEGSKLATDHTVVYLRYISSTNIATFSSWSPTYFQFVAHYLARRICARLRPEYVDDAEKALAAARDISIAEDRNEEPMPRARPRTFALTAEWLAIYNDAMFCMGLSQAITVNDDNDAVSKLDQVVNSGAVRHLLEDVAWSWANTSQQIDYNQNLTPIYGYTYGFDKPANMMKLDGIFVDEYMRVPLKNYADEGDYWFSDLQTIFVQFVSNDLANTPTKWPMYFRKLVAGYLAAHAAGGIKGADQDRAMSFYQERERSAQSNDAMASPPRRIAEGNWTRARLYGRSNNRGRP